MVTRFLALHIALLACAPFFASRAQTDTIPSQAAMTFAFVDSLVLPGTPEEVYDAATGDITGWWDHSFSGNPYKMYIEARPGGGFYELFNERGDGVLHASVTYAHRGKSLRFVGPLGLAGRAVHLVCTYDFAPAGPGSTRLLLTVRAAGDCDSGTGALVRKVWRHFLVERFKPYVEAGRHKR